MDEIIVTDNTPGNVHESAAYINKAGLSKYVISLIFTGGNYSTVVYKMPREEAKKHFPNRTGF
jgi:hypothetical protein